MSIPTSPNEKESRFTLISLRAFGLILFFASLTVGRAFGDFGWSPPRLLGVGGGVILIALSIIVAHPTVFLKMTRHKSIVFVLTQTTLFIWGLLIACLFLEAGTRLLIRLIPDVAIKTSGHLIASHPPPYRNAPYFSPEFLKELETATESFTPSGTHLIVPMDRRGTYINVSDSRRHTAFQPTTYKNTVYLFGGSTIFNAEVPDEYTIASQLQKLLIDRFGDHYRVENIGMIGVVVSQQLERLKMIPLSGGDIVIFYDGANDIGASLYHAKPQGFVVGEASSVYQQTATFSQRLRLSIWNLMGGRSEFVNVFLYPYDPFTRPSHLDDSVKFESLKKQMESNYRSGLMETNIYASARGVTFFHFFQPTIFTLPKISNYEKKLLNNKHIVYAGLDEAYIIGSPILRKVTGDLTSAGMYSFDISDVLNERMNGEEFYIDYVHVTDRAGARIALAIFDKVAPVLR